METWILIVFLASSNTYNGAGVAGVQAGLFASASQCKSAADVVANNAKKVSYGYANAVCVQTTHRSYSK